MRALTTFRSLAAASLLGLAGPGMAATLTLAPSGPLDLTSAVVAPLIANTAVTAPYTVIHTGPKEFKMSDSELGAMAVNPATSPPSISYPNVSGYPAPALGAITYDGKVAITNSAGQIDFSNSRIYDQANGGIDCENTVSNCRKSTSNSRFYAEGGAAAGVTFSDGNGIQRDQTATAAVRASLGVLNTTIAGLNQTGTLSGGLNNETFTIGGLGSGLHVIDITGTGAFNINNSRLLIDGAADTFVIFRLLGSNQFLDMSNSSILVGGDMGLNNVLFTTTTTNDAFKFSNVYFNGVSFWDFNANDKGAQLSDVRGCGQLIGGMIDMSNASVTNCAFAPFAPQQPPQPIPLPAGFVLLLGGLGAFGLVARRRRALS